jgi:hypothetical protein
MNTTTLKQLEISQQLAFLSDQQLEQIDQYLKTLFTPATENNQSSVGWVALFATQKNHE